MDRLNDSSLLKVYLNKTFIIRIFFVLSVIYFFSGIFYGLDFSDSFYHLNFSNNPPNDLHSYTFLLSSLIINILIKITDGEIIWLRFLNSLIFFFVAISPFIFLKTKYSNSKILFYLSCNLIILAPLNLNILGYDTLTILILAILFSVTLLYLKKSKIYFLLIMAILSSVAILIRLPNLILIPIILLVILGKEGGSLSKIIGQGKFISLYLFTTLLFVFLGYFIYYKDWNAFLNSTIISHNATFLVQNYLRDSFKLIAFISILLTSNYFFKKFSKTNNKILLWFLFITIHYLFLYKFILFKAYSYTYSIYLTSIALSIIIISLYNSKIKKNKIGTWAILLYVLFLFINPFGSDTGFLKAAWFLMLFPFILTLLELNGTKFWTLIIITLLPMAIVQKVMVIYEDSNIFDINKTINIDLLNPIRTTEIRYNYLKNIDQEVNKLQRENVSVFFYGNQSHIFHYLYPRSSMNIKSFRQPVDTLLFLPEIENVLEGNNKSALFLIPSYPEHEFTQGVSLMELELLKRGYERIEQTSFIYYYKIKTN